MSGGRSAKITSVGWSTKFMRIISGTYGGLRLAVLKGTKLRLTAAQLRETLFDILGPQIEGSRFLDAYAGSGAVGQEASSRGAARVVFTEHYRPAAEIIRKHLVTIGVSTGIRIYLEKAELHALTLA